MNLIKTRIEKLILPHAKELGCVDLCLDAINSSLPFLTKTNESEALRFYLIELSRKNNSIEIYNLSFHIYPENLKLSFELLDFIDKISREDVKR